MRSWVKTPDTLIYLTPQVHHVSVASFRTFQQRSQTRGGWYTLGVETSCLLLWVQAVWLSFPQAAEVL